MPRTGPLADVEVGGRGGGGLSGGGQRSRLRRLAGRTAQAVSGGTQGIPVLRWGKRMLQFPIGERFAVIVLGAALGGPRVVFVVFLAWVSLALAWSVTGRLLRSVAR